MTPGSEGITVDKTSEEMIQKISKSILDETFRWSRVKRIHIPKPGKKGKRPLGLPDYHNKLVQHALRTVLYSIYEPEMEKYNTNYGFRPQHSCDDAIRDILENANNKDWCIEGDIKGAFDGVNHKTLINILKERIKDKKLLLLIYRGLKSGIMDQGKPAPTLLGIPQGGIASPYLFNIYMHKLDKHICNIITPKYTHINETKNLDKVNPLQETLGSRIYRAKQKLKELENIPSNATISSICSRLNHTDLVEIINSNLQSFKQIFDDQKNYAYFKKYEANALNIPEEELTIVKTYNRLRNTKNNPTPKTINDYTPAEQALIKQGNKRSNELKAQKRHIENLISAAGINFLEVYKKAKLKEISESKAEMLNTPYFEPTNKEIKIYYKRYADDWTLWGRGDISIANTIKDEIASYLQDELQLTLSIEKTKITNLKEDSVKFLGFEIFLQKNPLIRRLQRANTNQFTQRFRKIQAHPELSRLQKRFLEKNYITEKGTPREIGFLTVLKDHEIIEKYNSFMIGIGNYYIRRIAYPSRLGNWHYKLYYSCIKTLATKHKMTVRSIINQYGYNDISNPKINKYKPAATDKRICAKYFVDNEQKWTVLLNYKEYMYTIKLLKKSNTPPPPDIDFIALNKVNFRTAFKLQTACAICKSREKLHSHHIKPLKHRGGKFTGYKGFDKIVAALGRKQIIVCQHCHEQIHKGKYDKLSLEDIYDYRLVTPENLIKIPDLNNPQTINPNAEKKQKRNFVIEENKKTYFNQLLYNYLQNKNDPQN